jgi:hypothetical protein
MHRRLIQVRLYQDLAVTREYHITLRNHAILGGKNNEQKKRLSEAMRNLDGQ